MTKSTEKTQDLIYFLYPFWKFFAALSGLVINVLATEPKACGFSSDRGRRIFKGDKFHNKTSFGGEVKPSPHIVRFYGMLKNPTHMKRDTSEAKFIAISGQISPSSLLDISAIYWQKALVDESGNIITHKGKHNISEMVAVYGSPYAISPCKQLVFLTAA
jgi:hypothetical protein